MEIAAAFEVFDGVVGAGLEGSIHARRVGDGQMDFIVIVSLLNGAPAQLGALAVLVEQHDLELDDEEHRFAEIK